MNKKQKRKILSIVRAGLCIFWIDVSMVLIFGSEAIKKIPDYSITMENTMLLCGTLLIPLVIIGTYYFFDIWMWYGIVRAIKKDFMQNNCFSNKCCDSLRGYIPDQLCFERDSKVKYNISNNNNTTDDSVQHGLDRCVVHNVENETRIYIKRNYRNKGR